MTQLERANDIIKISHILSMLWIEEHFQIILDDKEWNYDNVKELFESYFDDFGVINE